ncbi:DUF397 domain-containing protein [Streptomyces sp. NP-1717]|uniref:DUF397 domain-containing protein n=1 Tax=unclassified Streptomyces TaxID=2593676 RepID=UPI001F5C25EA|nr:DUF397 domain-containing protein [Streptomyces sp. NP-1717]MCI3224195.1 DUF397 domain-containing protein [Streptomyces sp. NP-1717]WTA75659.1 DUF397 domain-containing protein [Streptomyces sp. NBC_00838]
MSTEQVTAGPARLTWFKSSYSGSGGGDCVEVALVPTTVHIRDSKNTPGPVLHVSKGPWRTFLSFTHTEAHVAD